jgi:hypothetical protein
MHAVCERPVLSSVTSLRSLPNFSHQVLAVSFRVLSDFAVVLSLLVYGKIIALVAAGCLSLDQRGLDCCRQQEASRVLRLRGADECLWQKYQRHAATQTFFELSRKVGSLASRVTPFRSSYTVRPAVGGLPEQIRLGKLCIAPGGGNPPGDSVLASGSAPGAARGWRFRPTLSRCCYLPQSCCRSLAWSLPGHCARPRSEARSHARKFR